MSVTPSPAAYALAACLALAGCGTAPPAGVATRPAPVGAESAPPSGPAVPAPAPHASVPSADTEAPATTSGPLTGALLPVPSALGAGWASRVDPGSAEDEYLGNGTPTLERDPGEVTDTALPLGCERTRLLPTARHALEVDYTHGPTGTAALAIRLRFGSVEDVARFMGGRTADLRACAAKPGTPGEPAGIVLGLGEIPGGIVSMRTEAGVVDDPGTWTELAVSAGTDVIMLAAHAPTSRTDVVTPDRWAAALAASLR